MKIEIDIRDYIPPTIALEAVKQVVAEGKMSKGEKAKMYYCWATTFETSAGSIIVLTRKYRKNNCFKVCRL